MTVMNMDELVAKLLTDPKAREEWMEISKRLEDKFPNKEKKPEPAKKGPLKVLARHSEAEFCQLKYEDGYTLCFTADGGMFLEHADEAQGKASKSVKTISEQSPKAFKAFMDGHLLDLEDMMFVVAHTGYMFSKEAVKAFDRHKKVVAEAEQKTRYIHQDRKRAFMAGLVCGRNP